MNEIPENNQNINKDNKKSSTVKESKFKSILIYILLAVVFVMTLSMTISNISKATNNKTVEAKEELMK